MPPNRNDSKYIKHFLQFDHKSKISLNWFKTYFFLRGIIKSITPISHQHQLITPTSTLTSSKSRILQNNLINQPIQQQQHQTQNNVQQTNNVSQL